MYHYTECGLKNVYLRNGYREVDTPYGKGVSIEDVQGLEKAIGLHLVENKPKLTGTEFRFLRKGLDLSQVRIATMFGYDGQSVALWEKSKRRLPKLVDRVIRTLYKEFVNENASLTETINMLNDIDRKENERLVFGETKGHWQAEAA